MQGLYYAAYSVTMNPGEGTGTPAIDYVLTTVGSYTVKDVRVTLEVLENQN